MKRLRDIVDPIERAHAYAERYGVGTFHVQNILPGVYVAGSIMRHDEYRTGAVRVHDSHGVQIGGRDNVQGCVCASHQQPRCVHFRMGRCSDKPNPVKR